MARTFRRGSVSIFTRWPLHPVSSMMAAKPITGRMTLMRPAVVMLLVKASENAGKFHESTTMTSPPVSRASRTSAFRMIAANVTTVTTRAMMLRNIATLLSGRRAL
jgi:hypothetical protein